MTAATRTGLPPLRPYQVEVARSVLRRVAGRHGRSVSVEIARQGGKNELSAQVGLATLLMHATTGGTAERAGGPRRHFRFDWEEVARHVPAYRRYVEAERTRLGERHPLFRTQCLLEVVNALRRRRTHGRRAARRPRPARSPRPHPRPHRRKEFRMTTLDLRIEVRARPPREDALPEHVQYRDDGCDLFASCLSCPLPRCRYDVPGGARTMLNVVRDAEIRRMRFEGDADVDDIARRFRVSRRTVFRILRPGRASLGDSLGDSMGGDS